MGSGVTVVDFIRSDGSVAFHVYGQLRPNLISEGLTAARTGAAPPT
jgi:hypothetical protein